MSIAPQEIQNLLDEDQEKAADEATAVLLKRFPRNPDVQKAREEFDRARKVEEKFDGVDLTRVAAPTGSQHLPE